MRIPIPTDFKSRTGAPDKDARMTNSFVEQKASGNVIKKRPGALDITNTVIGVGQGGIQTDNGAVIFSGDQISTVIDVSADTPLTDTTVMVDVCGNVTLTMPLVPSVDQTIAITNVCGGNVAVDNVYSPPEPVVVGLVSDGVTTQGFVWSVSDGATLISGGGASTLVHAVSESGVVVGDFATGATTHAFKWDAINGLIDIGTLAVAPNDISTARAISPDGSIIVGFSRNSLGADEAFVWTQAGGMQGLGFAAGYASASYAYGVNNSGTIVGAVTGVSGTSAFIFPSGGAMTPLGANTLATAVSDAGIVVGYNPSGGGAFIWSGGFTYLSGLTSMASSGISRDGTQVSGYWDNAGVSAAFIWTQAGGAIDLSASLPAGGSDTTGVVNDGYVCGTATGVGGEIAYMWSASGGYVDIHSQLGWGTTSGAAGIAMQRFLTSIPLGDSLVFEASYYPVTAAPAFLGRNITAYLVAISQGGGIVAYGYFYIQASGKLIVSNFASISANNFASVPRTISKTIVDNIVGATLTTFRLVAGSGSGPIPFYYVASGVATNYYASDVNNVGILPDTITAYVR